MQLSFLFLTLSLLILNVNVRADEKVSINASRPVHTYSIVARDPKTGEMGVAVQSHWFSVGSLVAWGEAGIGVVATQSFIDVRYGASGLDLMRAGWNANQTLSALVEADPHPEIRQVAMIDSKGNIDTHTGNRCIQYAGHQIGENYSVQANLMLNDGVLEAMADAFENKTGSLAERMLAALDAAQAVGGDLRGKQAAAILVVKGENTGRPWADRLVDLNIEDHPHPLKELRRLLNLHTAYNHMDKGDLAIELGQMEKARKEYGAAQKMFPENLEMKFWYGVALVNAGKVDDALPIFKTVFSKDKNWATLIPRLSKSKLLPTNKKILDKIMAQKK